MVGSSAVDRYNTRRDEKVTYILRAPERRHRFGIASLAVGKHELFTAGRDGTVRAWTLPTMSKLHGASSSNAVISKCNKTFDEHADWVNDILLVSGCERLVSCSSDTSIKVWNMNDPSRSLRTLTAHTDYVKALASVRNNVASGSLDGRVLIWDLVTGAVAAEYGRDVEDGHRNGSIYCMAGSADGNILVSGSTDKTISVWDLRERGRIVHLRGHSDSVRCLTLKRDAVSLLSGATDATVKLWDLRQQHCRRSFDSFGGSVWALTANEEFNSFISGGRDGSIWYTDIDADLASAVVQKVDSDFRSNMVLDITLSPCKTGLWVSTTGSTVRLWSLPDESRSRMGAEPKSDSQALSDVTGRNAESATNRQAKPNLESSDSHVLCTIPGLPGIIAHRIMNDRRHVLTCDTLGEYKIWDITRGTLSKSLGIIPGSDIDDVLKKHDQEVSVPSWFQVDIRLGSLLVRLEKSTVAKAEIYAVDAGLDASSEDVKVNIGEHVVQGLFRRWVEKYKEREALREDGDEAPPAPRSPLTLAQKNAATRAAELPTYNFPDHIPIVITDDLGPVPKLRRTVGGFIGNEEASLPRWVVDLVRDGKGQSKEVVKVSFSLEQAEGCKLPGLGSTTLNAPRVLRVRKVTDYIAKELKDKPTGLDFEVEPIHLEVLCNGQPLPPTMSLATVKQFKWRSPDDLQLQYRLKKS